MKGLVLEGGGIKGSYQIGSYYAFLKCHIRLNGFVGTSIGSFNAAMLASGRYKELLDFWYNLDPGLLFEFDDDFVRMVNDKDVSIKSLIGAFTTFKQVISNAGLDNNSLMNCVRRLLSYDELMRSKCDFGLVTVKVSKFEPLYIYKEDIDSQEKLVEYIMASCYFPGIKQERIIDNHYYIDGGFYDNSPVKLLADKGYDKIYVVGLKGLGLHRSVPKNTDIIRILPSRDTGLVFELDKHVIKDNIMMGYYDTLRSLKNYDGYKFCFKRRSELYYKFITRKVDKRLVRRVMKFFKTSSLKVATIKAVEFILEKENVSYYDVYNLYKLVRKFKHDKDKHFLYRFVRSLSFW